MCHMARGWGGRLQGSVVAAALLLLGVLAFSVPALGADPPPGPKPDPPPKHNPPPPPPVSRPPAPQPVAPAPVAPAPVAAPSVVHPTAAERQALAKQRAKKKAARAARARAAAAKRLAAAHRRERAKSVLAVESAGSNSSTWGTHLLLAGFSLALLLLGLALTPAWAVPWHRASRALESSRDELGVMGAMGLVATVVFFLLVEVTK